MSQLRLVRPKPQPSRLATVLGGLLLGGVLLGALGFVVIVLRAALEPR